jgi:hypothetical protein
VMHFPPSFSTRHLSTPYLLAQSKANTRFSQYGLRDAAVQISFWKNRRCAR